MKTGKLFVLLMSVVLGMNSGCLKRVNVTALSQEQDTYYGALADSLRVKRVLLERGLTEQLKADLARQRNLLDWERDLQKAEVLLQVDADVTGNKKLLAMKLAELNLAEIDRLDGLKVNEMRKKAILEMYDKLSRAVLALKKNNEIILKYLASGDEKFALRSLDVESIANIISIIRDGQETLGRIETRSAEERQKESQRVTASVQRARELLLTVFKN